MRDAPLTPALSPSGRGRPLCHLAERLPLGDGDHRPLLPAGEKVPEGRMRGSAACATHLRSALTLSRRRSRHRGSMFTMRIIRAALVLASLLLTATPARRSICGGTSTAGARRRASMARSPSWRPIRTSITAGPTGTPASRRAATAGSSTTARASGAPIFSIWDTTPALHPHVTEADRRTVFNRFGGEGEGSHTHMPWDWKEREPFRFFVRKQPGAKPGTIDTRYYIFDARPEGLAARRHDQQPRGRPPERGHLRRGPQLVPWRTSRARTARSPRSPSTGSGSAPVPIG